MSEQQEQQQEDVQEAPVLIVQAGLASAAGTAGPERDED